MADSDIITLKFTREALETFIKAFNKAAPMNDDGYLLKAEIEEYRPGEATLLVTLETPRG